MSGLHCRARASTVLLAFACLAYAAGNTGDGAPLRNGAVLSRSASLRSRASRPEAHEPRRGSQLRGLRVQPGADSASAAEPWVWECESCDRCSVLGEVVAPPANAEPAQPLCTSCKGCSHSLELLNLTVVVPGASKGGVITMRPGNTGASVLEAFDASGKHAGVVKLHGVQSAMVEPAKLVQMRRRYKPGQHYAKNEHALARAAAGIAGDCGLSRVALREWVAPLRAVVPGSKEVVSLDEALWAERAEGVSIEALAMALPRQQLLRVLAAVPHQAVRDAVLFDVLMMQGDRHGENVFLSRGGRYIKLIDSRDAMLDANGLDSLFVPTTTTFQRSRVGWNAFTNGGAKTAAKLPLTLLDYRCHVSGGAIGFNYPPRFAACIASIANSSAEQLYSRYRLPQAMPGRLFDGTAAHMAERLRAQARLLRDVGFEATLQRTRHKNTTGKVPSLAGFSAPPPCCRLRARKPTPTAYGPAFACAANVPPAAKE